MNSLHRFVIGAIQIIRETFSIFTSLPPCDILFFLITVFLRLLASNSEMNNQGIVS